MTKAFKALETPALPAVTQAFANLINSKREGAMAFRASGMGVTKRE
jgi:hypothetical protein